MLDYLLSRLKERTTWAGLIGLAAAAGVAISPELADAIAAAGVAVAAALFVATKG